MRNSSFSNQWYLKDKLPISTIMVVPKGHITNKYHKIKNIRHSFLHNINQWYLMGKNNLFNILVVPNGKKQLNKILNNLSICSLKKFLKKDYSPIIFSNRIHPTRKN